MRRPTHAPELLVEASCPSPFGPLRVVASDSGLRAVLFAGERPGRVRLGPAATGDHGVLRDAAAQLGQYLSGKRRAFALPLDPVGTPWELEVWEALRGIPYGEVRTYGELAASLARPAAARAVGRANGRNPLSIVIPCHRLVGADGSLTGYGGGLPVKRALLDLEAAARRDLQSVRW